MKTSTAIAFSTARPASRSTRPASSHPDVVKAIYRAGAEVHPHVGDGLLLRAAGSAGGGTRVDRADRRPRSNVLRNSGTEATEAAIKLARYHTKRQGIIAFLGVVSRTLDGVAVADREQGHPAPRVRPVLPGVYHAPYPDPYRFRAAPTHAAAECLSFIADQLFVQLVAPDEVAAIVVEPIQGEGGYIVPPPAFLQGLRELATEHGILLVVDEVQSGMGRTGKMFASDHFGLKARHRHHREGHRVRAAARRHVRARRRDVVAAGRPRQHVWRESRVVRRGQRRRSGCSRTAWSPMRRRSAST